MNVKSSNIWLPERKKERKNYVEDAVYSNNVSISLFIFRLVKQQEKRSIVSSHQYPADADDKVPPQSQDIISI